MLQFCQAWEAVVFDAVKDKWCLYAMVTAFLETRMADVRSVGVMMGCLSAGISATQPRPALAPTPMYGQLIARWMEW